MKKKHLRLTLSVLAFLLSAAFMRTDAYCADAEAVVDPGRKGSIVIEYLSSDGRTPVSGASFVFRRIAEPAVGSVMTNEGLNDGIWTSLLGTMEINEFTDTGAVLAAAKEAYINGNPRNGGKTYSGVTDDEGRLVLDDVEQGLYVAEEVGSAKGYLESEPFIFSIPYVAHKPAEGHGTGNVFEILPERYHNPGTDSTGAAAEAGGRETGSQITGQVSERQYWDYNVYAQPKTRKEEETTVPEESRQSFEETTESETTESETTGSGNTEYESTEFETTDYSTNEYETNGPETTEAESTEPIYQSEPTTPESEPITGTSGSETYPEPTDETSTRETELPTPDEGKKRKGTVKTGDRSSPWLFISICLISVGMATILAVVIAERRRRRNEER